MNTGKPASSTGTSTTSPARNAILDKLRATLARPDLRFPPPAPPPLTAATRMTVAQAEGGLEELAQRFGTELEALHGSFEVAETPTEARLALINRIIHWMEQEEKERKGAVVVTGQERSVLAWSADKLPIDGVGPTLDDLGLKLVAPSELHSAASREKVRHIRYGISGVEAAFAATGSMLVVAGPGTNRAASLLPFRHIALIPFSRLYRNFEEWLAEQREQGTLVDTFRQRANLTLISGPSKSADLEMSLTLGVHGPKFVHAILFDDSPIDAEDGFRPSDLFDEGAPADAEEEPGGFDRDPNELFGDKPFDDDPGGFITDGDDR
jgi:L-lactate dehydrogenase complex protein LldG